MGKAWEADGLLNLPPGSLGRYRRNFLRQAVCELRFPVLMSLGGVKPPAAFANALRMDYPILEGSTELTLLQSGPAESGHVHIFKSRSGAWAVSLKSSSVSIETSRYTGFDDFRAKVTRLVEAARGIIDSDFLTRVGLRYVNEIDCPDRSPGGWINPLVLGPMQPDLFKGIGEYSGRLLVAAEDGGCLLQHGLNLSKAKGNNSPDIAYVIDIDAFRHDVKIEDVGASVDATHRDAFRLFDWALTERSREHLATVKP